MRLAHLSDLHVGKKFNELSLYEDQVVIFKQILDIIRDNEVDYVLISGDVYDKAQPSAQAVSMLSDFLSELSNIASNVIVTAGNHDAPARIAYGRSIFAKSSVYLSGKLEGFPEVLRFSDEHGVVNFVLLPFFRLHEVRSLFPEVAEEIKTYTDAVRFLLNGLELPADERKVILTHQYYAGIDPVILSDSEMDIIGGLDAIDVRVLEGFTYAALGHIHRPQRLLQDNFRYAGSPLAYSFSEINQVKSVPIIDLDSRVDDCDVRLAPLKPVREVRELSGKFIDLIEEAKTVSPERRNDILRIKLTDEERLINPMRRLQVYYPNIVHLEFIKDRVDETLLGVESPEEFAQKGTIELFTQFYESQTSRKLSAEDEARLEDIWNELLLKQEREVRE